MKLSFSEPVWEVIKKAASFEQLPYTTAFHQQLFSLISQVPEYSYEGTNSKKSKYLSRIKREIGFLKYIYNSVAGKSSMSMYYEQAFTFGKIVSGKLLQEPKYVKVAMMNGLLKLSDFEIVRLINGNRVSDNDSQEELVQVTGCRREGDEIYPFMSHEKSDFYGVYVGRPGRYVHAVDLPSYSEAMHTAAKMVTSGSVRAIDDATFYDN